MLDHWLICVSLEVANHACEVVIDILFTCDDILVAFHISTFHILWRDFGHLLLLPQLTCLDMALHMSFALYLKTQRTRHETSWLSKVAVSDVADQVTADIPKAEPTSSCSSNIIRLDVTIRDVPTQISASDPLLETQPALVHFFSSVQDINFRSVNSLLDVLELDVSLQPFIATLPLGAEWALASFSLS